MSMTTRISFVGYVAWLRRIDVLKKSAVSKRILTFKFDLSTKIFPTSNVKVHRTCSGS